MNINFKRQIGFAALAAVGAMAVGMGEVRAAIITLSGAFTSDHCGSGIAGDNSIGHCGISSQPGGSGGSISVTGSDQPTDPLATGTIGFDIQLLNGNQFINAGFDASFGFNLAGNPLITYSAITPAGDPGGFIIPDVIGTDQQAAHVPPPPNAGLKMDGTGNFEYGLEGTGNGGSDPLGSTLSFTISALGLDLADLDPNALGQFFAADIISGTTGLTGAIDVSLRPSTRGGCDDCTNVPEPGSLAALGSGLVSFGAILWWQQRRRRSGSYNGPALSA